jgi:hypothetical protein
MCEATEFGEKTSKLGKEKLSNVSKAVDSHSDKFMLVNCLYTKEKPIKIGSLGDVWRNENYALIM